MKGLTPNMKGQTLNTRDLAQEELEQLVRDLAARPEEWAHLIEHRPDARTYGELHRDEHVAVWLICWMDDHDTGYHDHDLSAGAYEVLPTGELRRWSLSYAGELRPIGA